MQIGGLRERIEFQEKEETVSAAGIVSAMWGEVFTRWGRVKMEDARADEQELGDRPMGQTRVTMIVRYDDRFVTGLRATWRGRVFEVTGVVNRDERRRFLDLAMIERKAP